MFQDGFFGSNTTTGGGGGGVDEAAVTTIVNNTVTKPYIDAKDVRAATLKDTRVVGDVPPAKYARLYEAPTNYEDTTHNAIRLNGVVASSYALKSYVDTSIDTAKSSPLTWKILQGEPYTDTSFYLFKNGYVLIQDPPVVWSYFDWKNTHNYIFSCITPNARFVLPPSSDWASSGLTTVEINIYNKKAALANLEVATNTGVDMIGSIVFRPTSGTTLQQLPYVKIPPAGLVTFKYHPGGNIDDVASSFTPSWVAIGPTVA